MPKQTDDRVSRREMLRALLGAGTMFMSRAPSAAPALVTRKIPKTGELLPVIGLGTWQTFDVADGIEARAAGRGRPGGGFGPGAADRAGPREVLRLFIQHGARMVDTSPMYGNAETVVGDLVHELDARSRLFLATKVWTTGRDEGIRQMETSMRRLRVTRLDLMQVHNLVDWATHLDTLHGWKEQGRVRYVGITHYTESAYAELARIIGTRDVDFVQLNYSIATREAEKRLLPLAAERRVGVIVNRPFVEGELFRAVRGRSLPAWAGDLDCTSWGQFFLKFIVSHPAVTCAIPATGNPAHLLDDLRAGYGRMPDAAAREKMARYFASL